MKRLNTLRARSSLARIGLGAAALSLIALGFAGVGSAGQPGLADLKVTKTAASPTVQVGSTLTYTIQVENLGPDAATGVTVTDPLPRGTDFGSASSTLGPCAPQGRKVTCAVGNLAAAAPGNAATITLNVVPRDDGPITNSASVKGDQKDPVGANDKSSVTTQVLGTPQTVTCRGAAATIVGTGGSDSLVGTGGRDVIVAFAGGDTIVSLAGRDLICAGSGSDRVFAGAAGDRVFGGAGRDRLLGRGGPDVLRGGSGTDTCRGGAGADSIRGCER